MKSYPCKLAGDFNSLEMLNVAKSLGIFGGMSHSTEPDHHTPGSPSVPTTEDSEITFRVTAESADAALSDIRNIAIQGKAESWTGHVMIFND